MIGISTVFASLLLTGSALAKNDWSIPCFDGECSYDSPAGLGSLRIWGSSDAITDITEAAGWSILDCDPSSVSQEIRLVCHSPSGCEHLWHNADPVGKLVRLPESCGVNAFARIARIWEHEDQTIPTEVLRRRQDVDTPVQGLELDTDFAAIDPAQSGYVNIEIQGTNVPDATGDVSPQRRSRLQDRKSKRQFGFIQRALKKFSSFDKSVTKELPPVNVDKTFNLLDEKLACPASGNIPAINASVKADVTTKAHVVVSIGIAASGTIVPPKLKSFGAFAGLDADFAATLDLLASATGTLDSGKVTLFQVGIPGLDFPGILTLGPSFKLLGQAKASLDVDVAVKVDLSYAINDAKLFFPPSDKQPSGGDFAPVEGPLKLSVSPSVASTGTVEAHIIPTIDLGISALGGLAEATIFLNLDASAALTLSLEAGTTIPIVRRQIDGVKGCVEIGAGLDVNAGADASFFGLFDERTEVNLFSRDFDLFKRCFGGATAKRRRDLTRSHYYSSLQKRALECPAVSALGNLVTLVDGSVIPA